MLHKELVFIAICWIGWVGCESGGRRPDGTVKPAGVSERGGGKADEAALPPFDTSRAYSDLFLPPVRLDSFISHQQLDDTLAGELRTFYRRRHFQFAWFAQDGLTEQALSFYSLYNYSKDSMEHRKWLDRQLDKLMRADEILPSSTDSVFQRTELLMTWRFLNYIDGRYGDVKEREAVIGQLLPVEKQEPMKMAAAVVDMREDRTDNPWYTLLKERLGKLVRDSARRADPVITGRRRKGEEKRLTRMDSVEKILINLERMKWMPPHPAGKLIVVNIPEFKMHVTEDGGKVFDMNIVVGKEGHSTILFSGSLDRIVFNPYWNIPSSIVKKEIMPEMEKDADYLDKHDMEVVGEEDGVPVIRQRPGKKNELGQMKFVFPNSFNIYFHDTPHKELFSRSQRAFSHGCIRLAAPRKLADYLLQPMVEWTGERVDSLLATGKEQTVKLESPVPVLICYFTAWVDEGGKLVMRKDIYGHDKVMAKKLFVD